MNGKKYIGLHTTLQNEKLSIIFENVALMSRELQNLEGIITRWASLATMKAGL